MKKILSVKQIYEKRNGDDELCKNKKLFDQDQENIKIKIIDYINRGGDIDECYEYRGTSFNLLQLAICLNHDEVVKWLLANTAININYESTGVQRATSLYWAIIRNKIDIVKLLIEKIKENDKVEVEKMLNEKVVGKTLLMHATGLMFYEIVEILLKNGANPNIDDPLLSAVTRFSVDQRGSTGAIIKETIKQNKVRCKMAKDLIAYGADPNKSGADVEDTPFIKAVIGYYPEMITLLLTQTNTPVDLNIKSDDKTPLQWAEYYDRDKLIKLLELISKGEACPSMSEWLGEASTGIGRAAGPSRFTEGENPKKKPKRT